MREVPERLTRIDVEDLACERGGRLIFRDLSFRVSAGEALALEGPNGAGKTSALRMLAGFLPPVLGAIRFEAGETIADAEERGKLVGWLGHLDGVKAQLSVLENIHFAAGLYGATGDARAALDQVGLGRVADLPGQYLSAGQRRRLALARLILSRRPLWLMDEPLAALDVAGKRLAADLIRAHCAEGGLVIAATHEALGIEGPRLGLGPGFGQRFDMP